MRRRRCGPADAAKTHLFAHPRLAAGLADVIGRRLGKGNPLPFNASKSWAGSAAMFLGSLFFASGALAAFSAAGALRVDWDVMAPALVAISAVATVVEAAPVTQWVDDNVTVPAAAMLLGWLILP